MSQANGQNGNNSEKTAKTAVTIPLKKAASSFKQSLNPFSKSDQAVVLKQSSNWSRGIVWSIIGVTVACVAWAYLANIEQVVTAEGKLKPQGKVKEVQVPLNGVIKEVYVKDGEKVQKGQLLAILDPTASKAQLISLEKVLKSLEQENQFYQTLMQKSLQPEEIEQLTVSLKLPKEVTALVRNRISLLKENNLFQMQLDNTIGGGTSLSSQETDRLGSARLEADSRAQAAKLEIQQQQEQLKQIEERLASNIILIQQDRKILAQLANRNKRAIIQAERSLEIDKQLLAQIEPLLKEGALGEYQVQKQRQAVSDRYKDLAELKANGQVEYDKINQQLQTHLSEVQQFLKDKARLGYAISQSEEKLINTKALTQKDVRDKIAENNKKLAEIDSNINKIIVENSKKIAETDSQISQAKVNLNYQELRAPEKGIVFDLQATPGYVPTTGQGKAVVKIVPEENLMAEVDVTNHDIGFVREGMKVDVRIDTFPYSEFGDIKGEVIGIGSDALPPDEIHKYYRFPTRVKLNQQSLTLNNRKIPLQSGMAVTVNIKVKEHRTVMSLFTELFTPKIDSLKTIR